METTPKNREKSIFFHFSRTLTLTNCIFPHTRKEEEEKTEQRNIQITFFIRVMTTTTKADISLEMTKCGHSSSLEIHELFLTDNGGIRTGNDLIKRLLLFFPPVVEVHIPKKANSIREMSRRRQLF